MAYSTDPLPASLIDVDAPMILFGRALLPGDAIWSLTEDLTAPDISLPGFPASRTTDEFWTRPTKPRTAATTHHLLWSVDSTRAVDACVVLGHNIRDAPGGGGSITLTLRTADDDTFTTNLATIATFSGSITTGARAVMLATGNQYNNVERLGLEILASGSWIPEVSMVFAGQRMQFEHKPDVPYDEQEWASDVRKSRSASGVVTLVKRSTGQRVGRVRFQLQAEAERDRVREYFALSGYGEEPFVLIPKPDTEPQTAFVLQPVDTFSVPMSRPPYQYEHIVEVEEMGPFLTAEQRQA